MTHTFCSRSFCFFTNWIDLWKSWLAEKEAKALSDLAREEDEITKKINDLISSIQNALPKSVLCEEMKESHDKSSPPMEERVDTEELGEWDDDFWNGDSSSKGKVDLNHDESKLPSDNDLNNRRTTDDGMRMKRAFKRKEHSKSYQSMKKIRLTLPMFQYRQDFLDTVSRNSVTVLCAETGKFLPYTNLFLRY